MKSQSQTCDDVEDLAILEVLDEVRTYTEYRPHKRKAREHTHTHTSFDHQYTDSEKTGNFPSFCQTAHSFIFSYIFFYQQHFSERLSSDHNSS